MAWEHPPPGSWIDLGNPEIRRHLLALARRHLGSYSHLADDVVSRSVIKWTTISAHKTNARMETVVFSEAKSVIRAERRARAREQRVGGDPVRSSSGVEGRTPTEDAAVFRQELIRIFHQERHRLDHVDMEVILLMVIGGLSITDVERRTGLARHRVKRSLHRWADVLGAAGLGPLGGPGPEPDRPCPCPR